MFHKLVFLDYSFIDLLLFRYSRKVKLDNANGARNKGLFVQDMLLSSFMKGLG
jgi:hypothetical protein